MVRLYVVSPLSCVFPNHVDSTELPHVGLRQSVGNISKKLRELEGPQTRSSSVTGKALNNILYIINNIFHCGVLSLEMFFYYSIIYLLHMYENAPGLSYTVYRQ